MTPRDKPSIKPDKPFFSSGPTAKIPGWSPSLLSSALVGRSHRSEESLNRLEYFLELMKKVLQIPEEYEIAIMPGSATGAIESAIWNFLGTRPVDALAFDVFGARWQHLLETQLEIPGQRLIGGPRSDLPELTQLNFNHDVLFTWNGSTGGLRLPKTNWIPDDRTGLTICDATSAVFTVALPWDKLDITAFSWQKGLGSEAAHGILVLGPRALQHLKENKPVWPVPCLYSLHRGGHFNVDLFRGLTLNTPSMLCLEDALMALKWAESIGGLSTLIQRTERNAQTILDWCQEKDWIFPLRPDPATRSHSTLCLEIIPPLPLDEVTLWQKLKDMRELVEREQAGYDFINHTAAQPCLRLWCGPTVESSDLKALMPWISYAYSQVFNIQGSI